MSSLFEKNLDIFGKRYGEEKEILIKELYQEQNIISGTEAIEDRKVLYVIKGEEQYQLDSMYNNENLLKKWYSYIEDTSIKRTYVFFGLGNGMFVRRILNELENVDCEYKIIVYEPGVGILKTVLNDFDISDIIENENVILHIEGISKKEYKDTLHNNLNFSSKYGMRWYEYINYAKIFPEEEDDFINTTRIVIGIINATRSVQERFGKAYYKNTSINIKRMIDSRSLWSLNQKVPKDIPAIIVSSGPSLSKNINELKKAKNRCLMIATDSAVPALLKENIIPDMYVCVDGQKHPRHFSDERTCMIPAVVTPFTSVAALKENQLLFFISDSNLHISEFMEKENIFYTFLSSGGSVANDAYSLAVFLGLTNIILVGQDLAYTGGKTHASNTVRAEAKINKETLIYTKDIYGNLIESSTEFELYRTWFENQIDKNKEIHLIDATEGGAYIKGTDVMTLNEAIDKYCVKEIDIEKIISNTDCLFNPFQKEAFIAYISSIPNELKKLKTVAKKCKKNYEEMYKLALEGKITGSTMRRVFSENTEIGAQIDENLVMSYIEYLMQDSIHEVLKNAYSVKRDTRDEILEASKMGLEYIDSVLACIDIMIEDCENGAYSI